MGKPVLSFLTVLGALSLSACGPEVGSREWCEDMDDKAKGDWTLEETKGYAANCVFRSDED